MSNFGDNVWRLNTVQSLTVACASGASVSTAVFGAQTYAIRLCFPSAAASNAVRFKIGSTQEGPAASSTADALLPANTIEQIKVNPGSRLAAISNDAATPVLNIVELSS